MRQKSRGYVPWDAPPDAAGGLSGFLIKVMLRNES
jgi:hypothetical protein